MRVSQDVRHPVSGAAAWALEVAVLISLMLLAEGPGAAAMEIQRDGAAEKKKDPAKAEGKQKKEADKKAFEWLSLEIGLVQVREKYLPAIVLFDDSHAAAAPAAGEARPGSDAASFFDEALGDSSLKDILRRYVLVRVTGQDLKKEYPKRVERTGAPEKGAAKKGDARGKGARGVQDDPPVEKTPPPGEAPPVEVSPEATAAARLGIGGERPTVVVLNYWEETVLRYVGELSARSKLKKELDQASKVNLFYATKARKLAPELENSLYRAKQGDMRGAVLKVRDLEGEKAQVHFDPLLKRRLNELIAEYRGKAHKAMDEANRLDTEKKYAQALEAFNKIAADFPFTDVVQLANKRKAEVFSKLTFGR